MSAYIRMMDVPDDANLQINSEDLMSIVDSVDTFVGTKNGDQKPGDDKILLGIKHDDGKPRLDLLPPLALDEVAKVLMFGAKKYDSWNWAKGMEWHRNPAAAMRHSKAFLMGEDLDPETGLCHMAHAACDALFATEYYLRKLGKDDRYKWGK